MSSYIFALISIVFILNTIFAGLQEKDNSKPVFIQVYLIIIFHCISFFILYKSNGIMAFYFAALSLFFLIGFKLITNWVYEFSDRSISNTVLFLMDISLVVLYRLNQNEAFKQLIWFFIGTVVLTFLPLFFNIFSKLFTNLKGIIEVMLVFLLILLLFSPYLMGTKTHGAYNWISIFNVNIQPSEFCKFIFIFYLALAFNRRPSLVNLVIPSVVGATSVFILVSQNDLGGALMFFVLYLLMMLSGTNYWFIFIALITAAAGSVYFLYSSFSHVSARVEVWKNPLIDPNGSSYQIVQSLFAIGNGAFGTGLGKGMPYVIPVATSDFIFSSICEEFGGIFAICVIMLIFTIFARSCYIAKRSRKRYLMLMCVGVGTVIAFQSFLIIGGVSNFIPITGVTLPLVSYGGSSAVVSVVMMGFVLYASEYNYKISYEPESAMEYMDEKTNRTINIIFVLMFFIFIALIFYLANYIFIEAPDFIKNTLNPRYIY
ncbi:MAG: FtsW/RodA/SpoVE family cell cycle protein [Lachnospirales bacterium]